MRITIVAVGRARSGPLAALYREYAGRSAWPVTLREVEVKGAFPAEEVKRREAALLWAAVPDRARTVVPDGGGRSLGSEAFAALLGGWRDQGVAETAFLIGGADGHTEETRGRADAVLSLGAMTWPHLLARGMLAEQLYRAQQILAGHPYHRG